MKDCIYLFVTVLIFYVSYSYISYIKLVALSFHFRKGVNLKVVLLCMLAIGCFDVC